jgi:hypothetical protein
MQCSPRIIATNRLITKGETGFIALFLLPLSQAAGSTSGKPGSVFTVPHGKAGVLFNNGENTYEAIIDSVFSRNLVGEFLLSRFFAKKLIWPAFPLCIINGALFKNYGLFFSIIKRPLRYKKLSIASGNPRGEYFLRISRSKIDMVPVIFC